ncbi:MAG: DUF2330 domain-containing protein [Sandaracinaceae bacterium]
MPHSRIALTATALALLLAPNPAHAFCGFYVSGAESDLYAEATMVVMMRVGTRTVLSMQNSYAGPAEDFAMVVPVPAVLSEDDVQTLPDDVFTHVDRLAAPRLVEYWEQDPCYQPPDMPEDVMFAPPPSPVMAAADTSGAADLGVTVEAEFVVGEYEIVILGAEDSSGLDTWLRQEGYRIPEGAGEVLRPYVEQGTKFFVARVDVERVTRVDGRPVLSPLRVHYDSPTFSLPLRLGLLNSNGDQDLIVHVLAPNQRYEVANYPNVSLPTNLVVSHAVRNEFGPFYASLFDRLVEQNPGHVVTEYSWDASSCDPCPSPPLSAEELMLLGADVAEADVYGMTLTRMHYRYGREGLDEDLVFRAAPPVVGGRGMPDDEGILTEQQATPSSTNNFQGRYVMLNWWEGELDCGEPVRGRWGGPPQNAGGAGPISAPPTAFVERSRSLEDYLAEDSDTLSASAGAAAEGPGPRPSVGTGGCASCSVQRGSLGWGGLAGLGLVGAVVAWRRRR